MYHLGQKNWAKILSRFLRFFFFRQLFICVLVSIYSSNRKWQSIDIIFCSFLLKLCQTLFHFQRKSFCRWTNMANGLCPASFCSPTSPSTVITKVWTEIWDFLWHFTCCICHITNQIKHSFGIFCYQSSMPKEHIYMTEIKRKSL